jgi:hypothetical protein
MPRLPVLTEVQVVNSYTGAKRTLYEKARISLMRTGLQERDSDLTSFVKFEKQDVQKAPRVINPRHPRFNLALGKYLKHAEKPIFQAINQAYGGATAATVIKGMNAVQSAAVLRDKWNQFGRPVAVGLDASKFDMHVSRAALRYEHSFYRGLFPGSPELVELLSAQEVNKGRAYAPDGCVKFRMDATRSSGDLNTSLGNCILMCALVHSYAKERGLSVELANNGDDCVVFLDESDLGQFSNGLSDWFRVKGFAMTVEAPARMFEELEFCQTRPVLVGGGWKMVRNHHAVVKKDPMCLMPIPNDRTLRKWMYAVGECGLASASGVPVQQAFYRCLLRSGVRCSAGMKRQVFRNTGWEVRANGLAAQSALVTDASRASYYLAYGITPDAQLALEKFYDTVTFRALMDGVLEREDLKLEPGLSLITTLSNATSNP